MQQSVIGLVSCWECPCKIQTITLSMTLSWLIYWWVLMRQLFRRLDWIHVDDRRLYHVVSIDAWLLPTMPFRRCLRIYNFPPDLEVKFSKPIAYSIILWSVLIMINRTIVQFWMYIIRFLKVITYCVVKYGSMKLICAFYVHLLGGIVVLNFKKCIFKFIIRILL